MKYNLTLSQINDLCEGKSIVYEGKTISLGETPKLTGEKRITDLDEDEVIHCKTKEEATRICQLMHEAGLEWRDGDSFVDINRWEVFKENTYYRPKIGTHADIDRVLEKGYIIHPSTDF